MSELKNCPFCGGEAKFEWGEYHSSFAGECEAYVGCPNCEAEGPVATGSDLETAKFLAASFWNARAERTCSILVVEDVDGEGYRDVELSCGHVVRIADGNDVCGYCPSCGTRILWEEE